MLLNQIGEIYNIYIAKVHYLKPTKKSYPTKTYFESNLTKLIYLVNHNG